MATMVSLVSFTLYILGYSSTFLSFSSNDFHSKLDYRCFTCTFVYSAWESGKSARAVCPPDTNFGIVPRLSQNEVEQVSLGCFASLTVVKCWQHDFQNSPPSPFSSSAVPGGCYQSRTFDPFLQFCRTVATHSVCRIECRLVPALHFLASPRSS